MLRRALLIATLASFAAFGAEPPTDEPAALAAKVELSVPAGAVAGPDFDVERATRAWVETLSPEQRARSDAYVAMQLSEYRKISPGRREEVIFYEHPSGEARVRAAMQWKAEHGGREPPAVASTP